MFPEFYSRAALQLKPGYSADPALEILFDKSLIAQIKIRQLELVINELEGQLDLARMQYDMLQKEYGG